MPGCGGRGWPGLRGLVSKEPWRAEHPALQPTGRTGCGPAGPVLPGEPHGAGTEQTHLRSQQDLSRTSCAMCPLLPCWVLSLGHPSRTGRTRLRPCLVSHLQTGGRELEGPVQGHVYRFSSCVFLRPLRIKY